ncbi:MAG TPA: ATP-binding cassette domain-containing protein [Steroidobacteraceae bacterium]|nr:ATP-binding cassette domain-containing protein [Steroidobacteraceae bacterium]
MSAAASRYLDISLQRVDLRFGSVPVLRGIDWRIRPGERWVLAGANGAGKTQLLKLLAGDVWPTPTGRERRRYRWRGEKYDQPEGVKDEIAYIGPERQDRYERYEWNHPVTQIVGTGIHRSDIPLAPLSVAQQRSVAALLARLRIAHLAHRRMLSMSYGERRLVLLARALAAKPALLLLDEVTNGLDDGHRERLLRFIAGTTRSALPWVYTTHRAEDIPAAANRLLVLERGRVLYRGALSRAALHHAFAVRRVAPGRRVPITPVARHTRRRTVLVALERASVYADSTALLSDIDMIVRRGDCWVVHGGNGAGKSTLLRTIYGDHAAAVGGSIRRAGVVPGVPLAAFRAHTGFIAPQLQTDQPQYLSVVEVVASGLHASVGLNDRLTARERRRALAELEEFDLAACVQRTLRELSYGQMRRVLFARAWIARPDILLLDEPYAGVDTATRAVLQTRVDALLAAGLTVVMATHHRSEWPQSTTHELQLRAGRVLYSGQPRR